jgi:hypothetical protein
MTQEVVTPDAFGATIFCDDVRFEMDGKVSLIGTYGGDMIVRDGFPLVLPKFAAAVLFVQKKEVFSTNLELRIFLPGDAEDKPSVVTELIRPGVTPSAPEADSNFIIVRTNMIFTPFPLDGPGNIKVRVARDGVLYGAGSLRIIAAPQTEAESSNASTAP